MISAKLSQPVYLPVSRGKLGLHLIKKRVSILTFISTEGIYGAINAE